VKIKGKVSDKEYLKMMEDEDGFKMKEFERLIRRAAKETAFSASMDLSDKVSEWEQEMTEDAVIPPPPVKRVSQATFIQNLREFDGKEQ